MLPDPEIVQGRCVHGNFTKMQVLDLGWAYV